MRFRQLKQMYVLSLLAKVCKIQTNDDEGLLWRLFQITAPEIQRPQNYERTSECCDTWVWYCGICVVLAANLTLVHLAPYQQTTVQNLLLLGYW